MPGKNCAAARSATAPLPLASAVAAGVVEPPGAAVEPLNGPTQSIRRELHFSIDDASGETIIEVVDAETKEVIRQIPPADATDVMRTLNASAASLLGDGRV